VIRRKRRPHDIPETIIGKNVTIDAACLKGPNTSEGSIRIDGSFRGNIDIKNTLVIGPSGEVIGDIIAGLVIVAGSVEGNIISDSAIRLTSTSRIVGNIDTITLMADENCQITGRCRVGSSSISNQKRDEEMGSVTNYEES